jgi:predicted house-cleaning noncanonical NTP pyrophosphatase (MazG superfamily)
MELPDDAPKFPKLPFLLGDVILLAVAAYVAVAAGTPLPPAAIYAITACVGLGAILAGIPFVLDYNRRQDALLSERQAALEALVRTTAAAAEQASISASGLHQIAELAQKNLRQAEQLPQKLQERIHEFTRSRDEAMAAELEALQQEVNTLRASEAEKLESAADKIQRSASELAKIDGVWRQQAQELEQAARKLSQRLTEAAQAGAAEIERRLVELRAAIDSGNQPSTTPPPQGPTAHATPTDETPPAVISAPVDDPVAEPVIAAAPASAEPAAARRPVKRRTGADAALLPGFEPAPAPRFEPSPDGATRINVTAYIGIGNRLFVRGEGADLSWDRGVALKFVSIGKWRWESATAASPLKFKLYKNDQIECTALGEVTLEPGQQCHVDATF